MFQKKNLKSLMAMILVLCLIFPSSAFGYSQNSTLPNVLLYIDSPLKQYKAGIPINNIQCKVNLVEIVKSSNSIPACVKPSSVQKLLLRGWAVPLENSQSTRTITLVDNETTLTLNVGEEFLLKLGENFDWNIQIDDLSIVSRVPNIMVIRGAQGIYAAHSSGITTLHAVGDPLCLNSDPPCKIHSTLFTLDIQVNP